MDSWIGVACSVQPSVLRAGRPVRGFGGAHTHARHAWLLRRCQVCTWAEGWKCHQTLSSCGHSGPWDYRGAACVGFMRETNFRWQGSAALACVGIHAMSSLQWTRTPSTAPPSIRTGSPLGSAHAASSSGHAAVLVAGAVQESLCMHALRRPATAVHRHQVNWRRTGWME